ncbi:LacI family DNA-binding transcriptional regulator [Treponema sp. OMZ 840]|uniref:LacI family DNA-binding transcriptional regulator n=1 Tax=Treponema sp. OMZ 840 TaxID=244313 RepID=UPI003D89B556
MNTKPTLRDIADKVQFSTATVSMILAGKKLSRFPAETIERVYDAARELKYTPKHGDDKTGFIVIVCPSIINPYFATLLQGMELMAEKNGYMTIIYNTYWNLEREKNILAFSKNPAVKGLIFSMIPQQPELVEKMAELLPIVTVGDRQDALRIDTVEVDNFDAGYKMGTHLISLGHKHVCYVSTMLNKQHSSRVRRYKGLCESFNDAALGGTVSLITDTFDTMSELSTVEIEHRTGKALAKRCIRMYPHVTAIVAINDMVAYGVIDEILEEGLRIPDDYSVCGFDNIYPSQFCGVGLTTIDHFINRRGQSAFSLLQTKIENRDIGPVAVTHLEFKNKLVARMTTGKPRRRLS